MVQCKVDLVLLVKVIMVLMVLILVETHTMNKVVVAVELVRLATLMDMDLVEMEEICRVNLEQVWERMGTSVEEVQEVKELTIVLL